MRATRKARALILGLLAALLGGCIILPLDGYYYHDRDYHDHWHRYDGRGGYDRR
jgi:hypothetical protein